MSEDISYAESTTDLAGGDHLVLLISAGGQEKRWPVVGADRAEKWAAQQQRANAKAYVIWFPLVRMTERAA